VKYIKGIVFWASIAIALARCGDRSDEDVLLFDPKVDMMFFNIDSLLKVTDTLGIVNDSLMVLQDSALVLTETIIDLTDSLMMLDQLIDEGQTGLIPVRDQLRMDSTNFSATLAAIDQFDSIMSASQTFWVADSINIISGLVLVSKIENLLNGRSVTFADSATVFPIPLDMNVDSSVLLLTLGQTDYALTLEYLRIESQDEFGRVTVQAFDLMVKSHAFDLVQVDCKNEDCIDSETTIRIYF